MYSADVDENEEDEEPTRPDEEIDEDSGGVKELEDIKETFERRCLWERHTCHVQVNKVVATNITILIPVVSVSDAIVDIYLWEKQVVDMHSRSSRNLESGRASNKSLVFIYDIFWL